MKRKKPKRMNLNYGLPALHFESPRWFRKLEQFKTAPTRGRNTALLIFIHFIISPTLINKSLAVAPKIRLVSRQTNTIRFSPNSRPFAADQDEQVNARVQFEALRPCFETVFPQSECVVFFLPPKAFFRKESLCRVLSSNLRQTDAPKTFTSRRSSSISQLEYPSRYSIFIETKLAFSSCYEEYRKVKTSHAFTCKETRLNNEQCTDGFKPGSRCNDRTVLAMVPE